MGAVRRCQPRQDLGLLHRHHRSGVRDRISVQPAERCVHPVARHEWHLANQQRLRHEHPSRREVQRRHDADAGGREVQLRPPEDPDAPAERALGVDGAEERQGCREHGRVHVRGQARLPAVRLLPLQRRDRPTARLQQVHRHRTDDGQSRREPDHRYRPVHVYVRCELHGSDLRLAAEKRLVGNQGAGPQAGAAVRRRHPQLVEPGGARQLPGREHRSLQQLRTEIGDQGQVQDLLQQGPVSPGCEHDVALPEHDEEAAQRSSSSAALSRTRST